MTEGIRIAIPTKGRMKQPSIDLLKAAGIKLRATDERSLFIKTNNPLIDVLSVRTEDIPEFVEGGAADMGITGMDMVEEKGASVGTLLPLGYGQCSLVLAAPEKMGLKSAAELKDGVIIATKFEGVTKNYLRKLGKKAEIRYLSGSVEIAPIIGLADVVVDLTSTGTTLKSHGLEIVDTILDSQAVLIANKESIKDADKSALIKEMVLGMKSVVSAEKKKYLMVNLPESALPELEKINKGALSPTITKLDKGGWIAVQMVVCEKDVLELIKKLKTIGGRDIVVLPIERLVE
jgi:ATP phosphoribosyltransferase